MPEAANKAIYLVDAYCDPVIVRIQGRACVANSASLHDFFVQMISQGKTRFVVDFTGCASMDSTFLGVLAGAALELRRQAPPGSLVLCRVGRRNLELLRNLGLHRLLTVDAAQGCATTPDCVAPPGRAPDCLAEPAGAIPARRRRARRGTCCPC